VGILLAVLIVFGLMSKNNEILALKSSGMSLYHLLKPVLLIGLLLSGLVFLLAEMIVPATMGKANNIWLREVRNERVVVSREKNIWIKGNHLITHVSDYNPQDKTILGVTLNYFDPEFRLLKRIDARRGSFVAEGWVLRDTIVQRLQPQDGSYTVTFYDKQIEHLDLTPDDLERVAKKSEEMGFFELKDYIAKNETEGYDASRYRVDLHAKIAFPLVCILMCMIGTGIAIRGRNREGLPVSIAYGIGVVFLYWIVYSFCLSLGKSEVLPPMAAAWAANLIFACLGGFILLNAE
jgi:lipopolysaccharide export system permease protein